MAALVRQYRWLFALVALVCLCFMPHSAWAVNSSPTVVGNEGLYGFAGANRFSTVLFDGKVLGHLPDDVFYIAPDGARYDLMNDYRFHYEDSGSFDQVNNRPRKTIDGFAFGFNRGIDDGDGLYQPLYTIGYWPSSYLNGNYTPGGSFEIWYYNNAYNVNGDRLDCCVTLSDYYVSTTQNLWEGWTPIVQFVNQRQRGFIFGTPYHTGEELRVGTYFYYAGTKTQDPTAELWILAQDIDIGDNYTYDNSSILAHNGSGRFQESVTLEDSCFNEWYVHNSNPPSSIAAWDFYPYGMADDAVRGNNLRATRTNHGLKIYNYRLWPCTAARTENQPFLPEDGECLYGVKSGSHIWMAGAKAAQNSFLISYELAGYVKINKTTDTSWTSGLDTYSLEDATFGIYKTRADAENNRNCVYSMSTDASGSCTSHALVQGTYYVKEIKASRGHNVNPNVYSVTVVPGGEVSTVNIDEPAVYGDITDMLAKIDQELGTATPEGAASLDGAQYRVRYYDLLNATRPAGSAKAIATWSTVNGGKLDVSRNPVSGSWAYKVNGRNAFPLGLYEIQEMVPPVGYHVNPNVHYLRIDQVGTSAVMTLWSGFAGSASASNPSSNEPVIRSGALTITKVDMVSGVAQGDASLDGAQFVLHNDNANPVVIGGVTYLAKSDTITLTIRGGVASCDRLPYGTYTLRETKTALGYKLNETWRCTVRVQTEGQTINVTAPNDVERGGLLIQKVDADWLIDKRSDVEAMPKMPGTQGDATMAGAKFGVYNNSIAPVTVNGKVYRKGEGPIMTLVTDELGQASTASNILPYGSYLLKELEAPQGYLLNDEFAQGVPFEIRGEGDVYKFTLIDRG